MSAACVRLGVVLALTALLGVTPAGSEQSDETAAAGPRVVILGFDGMDPRVAESMMAQGELPRFAELAAKGTFRPLVSSIPPQSPPAWASFATCVSPPVHGIFDFIRRTPARYMPGMGTGRIQFPRLNSEGAPVEPPRYNSYRRGKSFWKIASEQGACVKALVVPFAYPAEDLPACCLQLCGLDMPDLRGNQSTYFAFSEAQATLESADGGFRVPLRFEGPTAALMVPGLQKAGGKKGEYAAGRLTLTKEAEGLRISVQEAETFLREGEWSKWMEWSFAPTPKFIVRAISRFYLVEFDEGVKLYMTCLQYHPREPFIAMSSPPEYSSELADRYGLYKTIGWAYDTRALGNGDMSDEMFLEDVERTMAWRRKLMVEELDRGDFDLMVAAWTATDRVSHVFWHCRDPEHPLYTPERAAEHGRAVEDTYITADGIVGDVLDRLRPDDLLMVLSDHGFHSFRKQFSINTWLIRNGYLTVKGQTDAATAFNDQKFLNLKGEFYDWSRTKVYGLGLSALYLNLKGREGKGMVAPEDAPAVLAELRAKLLAVRDPDTGQPVFESVHIFDPRESKDPNAPDVVLGYTPDYQTCNPSAGGAAPNWLFRPNSNQRWTGDHAASAVSLTPGVFFSNQRVEKAPAIIDLGVTSLGYLGLNVPPHFEGKSLLD